MTKTEHILTLDFLIDENSLNEEALIHFEQIVPEKRSELELKIIKDTLKKEGFIL